MSYRKLLWDHQPITDFWQIGSGKARRLNNAGMFTMGQVAAGSQRNEEWFYKTFGIDAEILIDHAWGIEPVCMSDIKHYHASAHSLNLACIGVKRHAQVFNCKNSLCHVEITSSASGRKRRADRRRTC